MPDMSPCLLVFAKNPVQGRVKTRLAAAIGPEQALAIYEQLLWRTREVLLPLTGVEVVICHGDTLMPELAFWQDTDWRHLEQVPAPDLGDRMLAAFRTAFGRCAGPVCIIGTDCPWLQTDLLGEAFDALHTHDIVIGPAADGGYYLLGMRRLWPSLFADKAWSTDSVCQATLADAQRMGLTVHLLPVLDDVDVVQDWEKWLAR